MKLLCMIMGLLVSYQSNANFSELTETQKKIELKQVAVFMKSWAASEENIEFKSTEPFIVDVILNKKSATKIILHQNGDVTINGLLVDAAKYPSEQDRRSLIKRILSVDSSKTKKSETSLLRIIIKDAHAVSDFENQDQADALAKAVSRFTEAWRENQSRWFYSLRSKISPTDYDKISTAERAAFATIFNSSANVYKVNLNCNAEHSNDPEFARGVDAYLKGSKKTNMPRKLQVIDNEGNETTVDIEAVNTGNKGGLSLSQVVYVTRVERAGKSDGVKQIILNRKFQNNYGHLPRSEQLIYSAIQCCESYDNEGKDCVMKVRDIINKNAHYRPVFQKMGTGVPLKGTR